MEDVLFWSFATRSLWAALAVLLLWGLLRLWNHLTGDSFDYAFKEIVNDPPAAAVYFGLRFVGIALLVGMVLG
jgi:hypothetical protein